jgi:hypothetical protein
MSDDLLALLREAVRACEEARVAYAVIGAVARNAWAPPRATTDLDLAVAVDVGAYRALLSALAAAGLSVTRTVSAEEQETVPDVILLRAASGIVRRLDLLVAKTDFEREAIAEAVTLDLGSPCRVVRAEHLVVYKLVANRTRDLADAEEVLRTRSLAGEPVDLDRVRRWAREWEVEDRLDALLRRVRGA